MQPNISLLVPFRSDDGYRLRVWLWLQKYWMSELPGVEIVIGKDHEKDKVFSKAVAVNDAASRATGDIFVILDADCYLPGKIVKHCARRIVNARRLGVPMWFVPYRTLYRLTPESTERVLGTPPTQPFRFPQPPDDEDVESLLGTSFGHRFGALIMVVPREAFELVGGMDERFRGWGGEDVSFLRSLDTLYSSHRNTANDVLHLWHPRFGEDWKTRKWAGQADARVNDWLAVQYGKASGKAEAMREVIAGQDEEIE